jgi:hypothetical protein
MYEAIGKGRWLFLVFCDETEGIREAGDTGFKFGFVL